MSSPLSTHQQSNDLYEFSLNLKHKFRLTHWLILGLFTLALGGGLMINSVKAKHGMISKQQAGLQVAQDTSFAGLSLIPGAGEAEGAPTSSGGEGQAKPRKPRHSDGNEDLVQPLFSEDLWMKRA